MIRKLIGTMAIAAVLAAPTRQASAQVALGYTDIGGVIGLGSLGGANISFGGRLEHIFKALPDLGNGLIGIGVGVNYYSYSNNFTGYGYSFKYIPIGVTGNYHFALEDKKIDPFVGVGLGYLYLSCSYSGVGYNSNYCGGSTVEFVGRAGIRYFVNSNLAAYADAGTGAGAALNIGLTFKLK